MDYNQAGLEDNVFEVLVEAVHMHGLAACMEPQPPHSDLACKA